MDIYARIKIKPRFFDDSSTTETLYCKLKKCGLKYVWVEVDCYIKKDAFIYITKDFSPIYKKDFWDFSTVRIKVPFDEGDIW